MEFLDGFRESIRYSHFPGSMKTVVFFLARAAQTETKAQESEVSELLWLPEEAALAALTHESDRGILRAAAAYLRRAEATKGE